MPNGENNEEPWYSPSQIWEAVKDFAVWKHTNVGSTGQNTGVGSAGMPITQEQIADVSAKKKKTVLSAVPGWSDQCFLIDGWRTFRDKNKERRYRNIIPVDGMSGAELVSLLSAVPDAQNFFRLSPAQLSLLVPQIRLFIVEHDIQKGAHKKSRDREIYFDDYTREGDIERILQSGEGRGSGAGLKSFTYAFDGTNPATADNLIDVSVKMIFTDVTRFTRPQSNGVAFVNLIERSPKYLDTALLQLDPNYRKVKATVGWAIPRGKSDEFLKNSFLSGEATKGMVSLLETMQLNLFLTMRSHSLDFKNDGVVELTVKYRASIESELTSDEANLFFGIKDQVRRMKQDQLTEISNIKRDINEIQEDLVGDQDSRTASENALRKSEEKDPETPLVTGKDAGGFIPAEQQSRTESGRLRTRLRELNEKIAPREAQIEKFRTQASELEAEAEAQISLLKFRIYQSFIKHLTANGLIRWVDIKREDQEKWSKGISNSRQEDTSTIQALTKSSNKRPTADDILKSGEDVKYGKIRLNSQGTRNAVVEGGTMADVDEEDPYAYLAAGDEETIAIASGGAIKEGTKRIFYIYYGDLLDAAAGIYDHNLKQTQRDTKMRMFVSNLTFTERFSQNPVWTNLCDVPISLDEFTVWYKNKVIAKMLTKFTLLQFIRDSVTTLMTNALGGTCAVGTAGRKSVGIEYVQMALGNKKGRKVEPFSPTKGRYPRITQKRTIIDAVKKYRLGSKLNSTHIDYVVLHASSRPPASLKGNVEEDAKNGIYHLGIGLDRGIVKDIKFKATKMKYSDEARIVDQGMENLGQLFKKYDAEVTLWGCSLFRNGQYVYLDPRTMGVERGTAVSLGLGGYHNIYRVEGNITPQGYFVTLQTKFNSMGGEPARTAQPDTAEAAEIEGRQTDHRNLEDLPSSEYA